MFISPRVVEIPSHSPTPIPSKEKDSPMPLSTFLAICTVIFLALLLVGAISFILYFTAIKYGKIIISLTSFFSSFPIQVLTISFLVIFLAKFVLLDMKLD